MPSLSLAEMNLLEWRSERLRAHCITWDGVGVACTCVYVCACVCMCACACVHVCV